jgi:hypothetical protein
MAAVYAEFIGIIRRRGEVVLPVLNDNLRRTFLHTDAVALALFLINTEKTHFRLPLCSLSSAILRFRDFPPGLAVSSSLDSQRCPTVAILKITNLIFLLEQFVDKLNI